MQSFVCSAWKPWLQGIRGLVCAALGLTLRVWSILLIPGGASGRSLKHVLNSLRDAGVAARMVTGFEVPSALGFASVGNCVRVQYRRLIASQEALVPLLLVSSRKLQRRVLRQIASPIQHNITPQQDTPQQDATHHSKTYTAARRTPPQPWTATTHPTPPDRLIIFLLYS